MAQKLTAGERETKLKPLLDDNWTMVDGRDAMKKTFLFKDFNEAWGWMSCVALRGEKIDHHPEWFNVYNKVEVTWSTHDCGGLSAKDIVMAKFCDDTSK
ncbi:pterin-4-alpha-carbinolamine dehydratase-like [Homarus americanus]|uniref:pterin-4-alpha-carbinolamine dehydratase-like n=1 Tax=Homarus americanus TaxID=6706 RepID=UPI001C439F4B|nr:pterin-4-alpha-carbinolamine dehydratase-like [Homarus americanus]